MENKSHSAGLVPVTLARCFESFGYYGMRSLLMMFMMRSALQMDPAEASWTYSLFSGIGVLLPVLGGLAGDLLFGNKLATIIGGFVQALGCFVIIVPSTPFLYAGLLLIAIGAGMFNPNIMAQLKILYTHNKKATESAIQILYIGINIGSFLGSFLLGIFSGKDLFTTGFIIAGCMLCASSIIMLATQKLTPELTYSSNLSVSTSEKNSPGHNRIPLILLFVFIPMFWMSFYFGSSEIGNLTYETLSNSNVAQVMFGLYPGFMILLGVLFAVLWFYKEIPPLVKIVAGFVTYAIASVLIVFTDTSHTNSAIGIIAILIFMECLAELLISPPALAFIFNALPRKFCGTFIGLYFTLTGSIASSNLLSLFSDFAGKQITLFFSGGLCILLAILFTVLHFTLRNKPAEASPESFNQFQ